jgi:hypothetical protein
VRLRRYLAGHLRRRVPHRRPLSLHFWLQTTVGLRRYLTGHLRPQEPHRRPLGLLHLGWRK